MVGASYFVNEKFFDKWNPAMAYVLGFIYADGSIYPSARGKYLTITSVDKEVIILVKRLLQSEHTIREEKPTSPNGKKRFVLRIGNKNIYRSLSSIGLYPNKSLTIKIPMIPERFLSHFVRGYFDGDGCVHLWVSKGRKKEVIVRKLSIIFTSGSRKFLEELLANLKESLVLKQRKIYDSHRSFQLRLATVDSIQLFKFLYHDINNGLFLKRKLDTFAEYFRLRPSKVDREVKSVLG